MSTNAPSPSSPSPSSPSPSSPSPSSPSPPPRLSVQRLPGRVLGRLAAFLSLTDLLHLRQCCSSWRASLPLPASVFVCLSADTRALPKLRRLAASPLSSRVRGVALPFCAKSVSDGVGLADLLASHYSSLTRLSLDGCYSITSTAMQSIGRRLTRLRRLSLYWCPQTDDAAVDAIATSCSTGLHTFSVSGAHRLTDAAVESCARHCPNLQHLDLTKVVNLTDASIRALGRGCPQLVSLNLYACPNFTDDGVAALVRGCTRLEHLDICGGQYLGDAAIDAIARHCPRLQKLNLTWCTRLTDASLRSLAEHCRHLKHLSVFGLKAMTDDGLTALARGCAEIQYLDVNGCPHLRHWSLETLQREGFPRLHTLAQL